MGLKRSLAIFLGGFLALTSYTFAENTARALFMSTAESKIIVSSEKQKSPQTPQKVAGRQTSQRQQSTVAYGFQFQVFLVKDGKEIPVNPANHVFREGDRFRVQIVTNTPGIIMISNRDPLGRETYLGSWPIERAFSKVLVPAEGYFEFFGPKGEDLLYVFFMPCRVEENVVRSYRESGLSRSIRVVADDTSERLNVREDVSTRLPICSITPQNERAFYENRRQRDVLQVSHAKSIRVTYDNSENAGYVLYSSRERQTGKNANSFPTDVAIFSVIRFNYR